MKSSFSSLLTLRNGIILLGVVSALFVWLFGARLFRVDGLSMYPSFNRVTTTETFSLGGDYLVIDIFSYLFVTEPQRFDVVVFRSPIEPQRFLLKRIIGLPGEQVTLSGSSVSIRHRDGKVVTLEEEYVALDRRGPYTTQTFILEEDEYFLLGDNRTNSRDSRSWGGLSREHIVGRVFLRLYPLSDITLHPGAYTQ